MKRTVYLLLVLAVIVFAAGETVGQDQEVSEAPDIQAPAMSREEYPRVDGSTATIPLAQALYQAVTGASAEEAEASVSHSKTTRAYEYLILGSTDLVIAYEPSESVFDLMEERQVKLRMEPIGRDALVFLVNSGNPAETVTSEELADIYSGRITNWKELGGKDQELVAFQRPENSGSQTLMEKLVMKETPMMEAPITRKIGEMGELIEAVAAYDQSDNALGYSVYYYARNMYQVPELRFLAVDGVEPSNDTIQNGTYPFVNEFYAVIREDEPEDSSAGRIFSWLTGEEGQRLVERTGYVPMKASGGPVEEASESVSPDKSYLKEDQRLCVDGSILDGLSRLVVFDGRFQQVKVDEEYRPVDPWQVCRTTEPLLLETVSSEGRAKRGLYCLEEERWFLQPEYEVLWKQPDAEDGRKIWWAEQDENFYTISWEEGAENVAISERNTDMQLGGFFWHELERGRGIYEIRDSGGALVNRVDLSPYGRKTAETVMQDHVLFGCSGEDGSVCEIYFDSRGNVLLDPETMKRERMAYITTSSPEWGWLQGYPLLKDGTIGEERFVYSFQEHRFLTEPGDQVITDRWELDRCFEIERDGARMVLDEMGQPVCDKDGRICTDLLGDGYLGIRENGVMQIVKEARGPVICEIPCLDGQRTEHVFGPVFSVGDDGWSGSFYRGEKLLLESGYGYPSGKRYILSGTKQCERVSMVLDEEGEILYQSELGEDISMAFEEFMLIYRGNYWNLADYDGRVLLKGLRSHLWDD